jgi:hypothetical protein
MYQALGAAEKLLLLHLVKAAHVRRHDFFRQRFHHFWFVGQSEQRVFHTHECGNGVPYREIRVISIQSDFHDLAENFLRDSQTPVCFGLVVGDNRHLDFFQVVPALYLIGIRMGTYIIGGIGFKGFGIMGERAEVHPLDCLRNAHEIFRHAVHREMPVPVQ